MTPEITQGYAVQVTMASGDCWVIPFESKEEAQDLASAVRNAIHWCERVWVFEDAPFAPESTEITDLAVNPAHIESVYVIRTVGE